mgnify:CR=1 FL=1
MIPSKHSIASRQWQDKAEKYEHRNSNSGAPHVSPYHLPMAKFLMPLTTTEVSTTQLA